MLSAGLRQGKALTRTANCSHSKSTHTTSQVHFAAAIANPRLRLLNLMREELCVCFFSEVLQANLPKLSRHLAYLRKAGIVAA